MTPTTTRATTMAREISSLLSAVGECRRRCSKTHHKKPCLFFCNKCCAKCLCVPPAPTATRTPAPATTTGRPREEAPSALKPSLASCCCRMEFLLSRPASSRNKKKLFCLVSAGGFRPSLGGLRIGLGLYDSVRCQKIASLMMDDQAGSSLD
ncbi:hypothetical protein SEVIR_7G318000v4 [Setaria viridis]|uniref:Uncharacterized protein n=1 Tax=Setaria viridis TaxID=4556 RepID=A0A4U6U236_SETVI|nr:hypothetical protein SEVIR_7G318000v2 [Setaria viridis]